MTGKRGPLHDLHAELGARLVTFSGFEMPVFYDSIQREHDAVRERVGLFDVSHMSNLRIEGKGATALVAECTVSDPRNVADGHGVYTVIPDEAGMILDDTIYYRINEDAFYMVPNAGMNQTIGDWLRKHAPAGVEVLDVSRDTCIFALQGPKAAAVAAKVTEAIPESPRFATHQREIDGAKVWFTTTGYTGENGYELFVDAANGPKVFRRILDAGKDEGILPVGLGARDTLRLEMGYCLAGHEFKGGRTPLEASLGWTIKWDHDFIGKAALVAQKERGGHERLVGIRLADRGIPREDYAVLDAGGARIGSVTSGTLSPTLKSGIALAYLDPVHAKPGTSVRVEIRGKGALGVVQRPPFLKR